MGWVWLGPEILGWVGLGLEKVTHDQLWVGADAIPIAHPINLALFGHKITLYRFNQGAHTIAGGLKSEQGLNPLPPHFNHRLDYRWTAS